MPDQKPTLEYGRQPKAEPRWIPAVASAAGIVAGQSVGWAVFTAFGGYRFVSFGVSGLAVAFATDLLLHRWWRRTHRK